MEFIDIDIAEQARNSNSTVVSSNIISTINSSSYSAASNLLTELTENEIVKFNGSKLVNSIIVESGDTITVHGNIVATGEISAYGLGGTGSTGGGLIDTVYGINDLNDDITEDFTSTFNAYTIKTLNNKITDLETVTSNQSTIISNLNQDKSFTFNQNLPSATWYIQHNMNKYPSVTVVDSAGTIVEGSVDIVDTNNIIISFSASFSGKANLN